MLPPMSSTAFWRVISGLSARYWRMRSCLDEMAIALVVRVHQRLNLSQEFRAAPPGCDHHLDGGGFAPAEMEGRQALRKAVLVEQHPGGSTARGGHHSGAARLHDDVGGRDVEEVGASVDDVEGGFGLGHDWSEAMKSRALASSDNASSLSRCALAASFFHLSDWQPVQHSGSSHLASSKVIPMRS